MGEFTADWLNQREAVDARSRNQTLIQQLQHWPHDQDTLTVLDLGTGAGSNVRFLIPRLPGPQRWILVDNDPALLIHLESRMMHWARRQRLNVQRADSVLRLLGNRVDVSLETCSLDLATALTNLNFQDVDLVTASALLDLVSTSWLNHFAQCCRDANTMVFLALTYDGLIRWYPEDPDDILIRHSFNAHQRNDKGFGAALGPGAASYAVACLQRAGYRVFTGRSDWYLNHHDQEMQAALLASYAEVAIQQGLSAPRTKAWLNRRYEQLTGPCNGLTIGHIDIFAKP